MIRKLILLVFTYLQFTTAIAADLEDLAYEINGKKYIATTMNELRDARSFLSQEKSFFYNKRVVFLVQRMRCTKSSKERKKDPYILITGPNNGLLTAVPWKSYFSNDLSMSEYDEELAKCEAKKTELDKTVMNPPLFYVWGKVLQKENRRTTERGEYIKSTWGKQFLEMDGFIFTGSFSGNILIPSFDTVSRIAVPLLRGK